MFDYLKTEWRKIKASKTLKLAWLKKIAGVVTVLLALSGQFEAQVDPMWFGVIVTLLGLADNKLRKVTATPL
jgi:hypothetical protein